MQVPTNELDNYKVEGPLVCETIPLNLDAQKRLDALVGEPVYKSIVKTLMEDGIETAITGSTAYEICRVDAKHEDAGYSHESMSDLDVLWAVPYSDVTYQEIAAKLADKFARNGIDNMSMAAYPDHFYPKFAIYQEDKLIVEVYFLPDCTDNISRLRNLTGQEDLTAEHNSRELYAMSQQSVQESLIIKLSQQGDTYSGELTRLQTGTSYNDEFVGPYREVNPLRIYSPENMHLMLENAETLSDLESAYVTLLRLKLSNLRGIVKASEQTLYNLSWETTDSAIDMAQQVQSRSTELLIDADDVAEMVSSKDSWYKAQATRYLVRTLQADPIRAVTWFGEVNLIAEVIPDLDPNTASFFDFRRTNRDKYLSIAETGRSVLIDAKPETFSDMLAILILSSGETDVQNTTEMLIRLSEKWPKDRLSYSGMGVDSPLETRIDTTRITGVMDSFTKSDLYINHVLKQEERLKRTPTQDEITQTLREAMIYDSTFHKSMHDTLIGIMQKETE